MDTDSPKIEDASNVPPVSTPAPAPLVDAGPAPAPESPAEPAAEGEDPEAPYGRKADGTPRAKPGRKSAGAAQRERLESVTPAPPRVDRPRTIAPPAPVAAPPAIPVDYTGLGRTAANLWFNVGQIPFGEDWAPNVEAKEHEIVAGAFRDYFKAKNVSEIDPTVGLCLVLGSYTLARVTKPTIKQRIAGAWAWARSKFAK
jgi:hypothetical protein